MSFCLFRHVCSTSFSTVCTNLASKPNNDEQQHPTP